LRREKKYLAFAATERKLLKGYKKEGSFG